MEEVDTPHSLFFCRNRGCSARWGERLLPLRHCGNDECCKNGIGTHYPLCDSCGRTMDELAKAPSVIWTGSVGQRYRDKDKDGYHKPDGMVQWKRRGVDGKPLEKPQMVHLETFQDVSRFCKEEGLVDPREISRGAEVSEDGKKLSTAGMPGCEI